jgi:hypothetical protein
MLRVLLALVGNKTVLLLALLEITADVAQFAHERLAELVLRLRFVVAHDDQDQESVAALGAVICRVAEEVLPFTPDENHAVSKLHMHNHACMLLTNPRTVPVAHRWQWMASECVISAFATVCAEGGDEEYFGLAFGCTVGEAWASIAERLMTLNQIPFPAATQEAARMVCNRLRECVPYESLRALDTGLFGRQRVIWS